MHLDLYIAQLNTDGPISKMASSVAGRCSVVVFAVVLAVYLSAHFSTTLSEESSVHGPKANSLQCALCEFLVKEVVAYVELDKTETKIMNDLKEECPKLFNLTLLQECNQFFDEYGSTVLKLVLQEVNPAKVCDHLIGHNTTCVD